jgi:hypothetical protein
MAVAEIAVVHGGHAFSGGATARVVDDMGADMTGCRSPSVTAP